MSVSHITGSEDPVVTGESKSKSDKDGIVVTVEGPYSDLTPPSKGDENCDYLPSGFIVESATVDPAGNGFGKMTIRGIAYGSTDISTLPERTTWKISMQEVQKDLKMHPSCVGDRAIIEKWLATDPDKRYNADGDPQWVDAEETEHAITEGGALKYIGAYEAGIESYVVHYPVIEKLSYYKTLPGCSMSGNSTTSGTVSQFSADIDKWNVPDVKLAGYANTGWFKSGDNYEQGNDLVWTRTEQWTWTPDGSTSELKWIYQDSSAPQNNA